MRKVYITPGLRASVASMFARNNHFWSKDLKWEIVEDHWQAEYIVFTGGEDISPAFYDHKVHTTTQFNNRRDEFEKYIWDCHAELPTIKLGICRGAQLLNAFNGGWLIQDVDGHGGTHEIVDTRTGEVRQTSSLHHQMMMPTDKAEIIAVTKVPLGMYRAYWDKESQSFKSHTPRIGPFFFEGKPCDPEVLWYTETKSFCFQGHPEFGPQDCTNYFFELVDEFSEAVGYPYNKEAA